MKASAIITNYNYAQYLPSAVESILLQTRPVSEIVIVDDGSTDDSEAVIKALAERHSPAVRPIFQANAGQAAAINKGFSQCSGDIILMMDADDVWDETKVERVVGAHSRNASVATVMHRLRHIDGQGKVIRKVGCPQRPSGNLGNLLIRTGGAWIFGATSSLSFSRRVLEQVLPIPAETWRLCADGALAYPAAFLGETISLDEVLGSYRIHGDNNHAGVSFDGACVQSNVEMTNRYLNDFLGSLARDERVDLEQNLHYRRDRYYRIGGGANETAAIAKLITRWPLYSYSQRMVFMARFFAKAMICRRWTS